MIKINMWYGNSYKESDRVDIEFYGNTCEYRGNIYEDDKVIGDYTCNDSIELEKKFSHLQFNW